MKLLFTALSVLNKITNEKMSFTLAISECLRNDKKDVAHRKDISALVGCALRHYLVISYRFNEIEGHDDAHKNAFILAVSNILLTKKVPESETYMFLKQTTPNDDLLVKEKEFIEKCMSGMGLIPAELDITSLEYLSFRYNTPLWLVKMWRKHYGYKNMRRILVANSKHFVNYARVNNELVDEERFAIENPTFIPSKFNHLYTLEEKCNIKKTKAFLDEQILVFPVPLEEVVNESDADSFRGIAAFTSTPNNLLSALTAKLTSYVEMDYLIGKQQAYFEIKQEKEHYNLKNVHLYEGEPSGLITCISKKVHTMFVIPESSNFFLLRNTPDYFIRFDQNSLDKILLGEEIALNEAAPFVEDGGYLVYIIPTISEKESHGIIENFLAKHSDFTLVNERQIMPYHEFDTTMFYAIMMKDIKHD